MMSIRKLVEVGEPHLPCRWYVDANQFLTDEFGHLGGYIADLLAVFSPRVTVYRSAKWTLHWVATGTFMPDVTRGTRSAVAHYEATGEIRGPKTSAFARNLRGDYEPVVLDTWMAKLMGVDQRHFARRPVYRQASSRVRSAARKCGVPPAEMQAALWSAAYQSAFQNPNVPCLAKSLRRALDETTQLQLWRAS